MGPAPPRRIWTKGPWPACLWTLAFVFLPVKGKCNFRCRSPAQRLADEVTGVDQLAQIHTLKRNVHEFFYASNYWQSKSAVNKKPKFLLVVSDAQEKITSPVHWLGYGRVCIGVRAVYVQCVTSIWWVCGRCVVGCGSVCGLCALSVWPIYDIGVWSVCDGCVFGQHCTYRVYTHAVEHVDHVFSRHISRRTNCIWTATQTADRSVHSANTQLLTNKNHVILKALLHCAIFSATCNATLKNVFVQLRKWAVTLCSTISAQKVWEKMSPRLLCRCHGKSTQNSYSASYTTCHRFTVKHNHHDDDRIIATITTVVAVVVVVVVVDLFSAVIVKRAIACCDRYLEGSENICQSLSVRVMAVNGQAFHRDSPHHEFKHCCYWPCQYELFSNRQLNPFTPELKRCILPTFKEQLYEWGSENL